MLCPNKRRSRVDRKLHEAFDIRSLFELRNAVKTFLKISVEKRYHFLFKSQFKAQVVDSADSSSEEKWTENLDKLQRELQELHVTSKEER